MVLIAEYTVLHIQKRINFVLYALPSEQDASCSYTFIAWNTLKGWWTYQHISRCVSVPVHLGINGVCICKEIQDKQNGIVSCVSCYSDNIGFRFNSIIVCFFTSFFFFLPFLSFFFFFMIQPKLAWFNGIVVILSILPDAGRLHGWLWKC